MTTENQLAKVTEAELAQAQSQMQQVYDMDAADFVPSIRVKNPTSEIGGPDAREGDMIYGKDRTLVQPSRVLIGPWRYAARLWKGKGNAPEIQTHNRSPGSRFVGSPDAKKLIWIIPKNTQNWEDVVNKKTPDDFKKGVKNHIGFDVLHYLPDEGAWGIYFCAGKSKPPTSPYMNIVTENLNRAGMLSFERGPGKNKYYIPKIILTTEEAKWPENWEEVFTKFLDTPIEDDSAPVVER